MRTWLISLGFLLLSMQGHAQPLITAAEYFVDTDPGFGNAIAIPVSNPAAQISQLSFDVALDGLQPGVHVLFVRSRDANGRWSITSRWPFYKPQAAAGGTPQPITAIEYFVDSDPGFGKGVPVAVMPSADISNKDVLVNISGLSAGEHRLFVRSRNAAGFSITNELPFTVTVPAAAPQIVVNATAGTQFCARDSLYLSFDATGSYLPGNLFQVELSNSAGSFASPVVIGSLAGTGSAVVGVYLPGATSGGSAYRLRVVSSTPAVTGIPGQSNLIIGARPDLGQDTTVFHTCPGTTVNLLPLYNTAGLTAAWNVANPAAVPPGQYRLIVNNEWNCPDTAFATTILEVATWTGALSNNWHTPGNWNIGKVPTDKTHVIIPAGSPNPCVVGVADALAASVQVHNGAVWQVSPNRILAVAGTCSVLPPN